VIGKSKNVTDFGVIYKKTVDMFLGHFDLTFNSS